MPLAILAACLLAGTPAHAFWPFTPPAPPPDPNQDVNAFTGTIGRMADQLTAGLQEGDAASDHLAEGIVFCSFVELKQLTCTSSFGRYVAEQLMSELQHRGYRVVELRKANSILVQEGRGEYGLSRNPAEIPGSVPSGAMVTGTYTVAEDHILVNARLLDNRTAALLGSATTVFPKNALTTGLLADRISAGGPAANEVVYLKRLKR
ncbi:MAG: FlgO family outer membrane protein [Desulfobacteraceae bacterium]|nr:FlgO family outer membrane protein [Desulfobacteraceae bacterium]